MSHLKEKYASKTFCNQPTTGMYTIMPKHAEQLPLCSDCQKKNKGTFLRELSHRFVAPNVPQWAIY